MKFQDCKVGQTVIIIPKFSNDPATTTKHIITGIDATFERIIIKQISNPSAIGIVMPRHIKLFDPKPATHFPGWF